MIESEYRHIVKDHDMKFEPWELQASPELRQAAYSYIDEYSGSFSFIQSLQAQAEHGGLTARQLAAALNVLQGDIKRHRPRATSDKIHVDFSPTTGSDAAQGPVHPVVADGTYTMILSEGLRRTVQLETVDPLRVWGLRSGTQVARYLYGPDNTSNFKGFAWVRGGEFTIWRGYAKDGHLREALRVLLTTTDEQQANMGESYALASGRCWKCGKKLTVPASIYRGLGPICAKRLSGGEQ